MCTSVEYVAYICCYLWRPQTDKLCQNGFFLQNWPTLYSIPLWALHHQPNSWIKPFQASISFCLALFSSEVMDDRLAIQHLMWSCPKKLDHDSPLENSKGNSWASTTRAAAVKFFLGSGMVEDREKCLALSNFEKWQITTLWQVCGPNHHVNMRKMMMMAQV